MKKSEELKEECVYCNRELLPGVRAYATSIGDMLPAGDGGFASDVEVPWEDLHCPECHEMGTGLIAAVNVAAYNKGKTFTEVVGEVTNFLSGADDLVVTALGGTVRVKTLLQEVVDRGHEPMEAIAEVTLSGIHIIVPSVETWGATPGHASPVFIEQDNGQLVCRLYDETDESPVVTKRWAKEYIQKVVLYYKGFIGVPQKHWVHACDPDTSKIVGMKCSAVSKEDVMTKATEMCDRNGWIIVPDGGVKTTLVNQPGTDISNKIKSGVFHPVVSENKAASDGVSNSLRDEVKDVIAEILGDYIIPGIDAREKSSDIADAVFETLGIPETEQDLPSDTVRALISMGR
ncbi:MAG: hypothetical protein ACLQF0_06645 [Dissulfurispiraceae bacterium]